MTTHSIFIPNWRPKRLNELLSVHHMRQGRLKKADARMLQAYFAKFQTPKATGKRLVELHIILTGQQKQADPDAYWKSLLDGLVKCGQLVDDKPAFCSYAMPTYERGTKEQAGTRITLTDI